MGLVFLCRYGRKPLQLRVLVEFNREILLHLALQTLLPFQLLRYSSILLAGALPLAVFATPQAGTLPEPQLRPSSELSSPQPHPTVDRSKLRAEWQAGQSLAQKNDELDSLTKRLDQMNVTVNELRQLLAAQPSVKAAPTPPVAPISPQAEEHQNELPWPWFLVEAGAMAALGLVWSRRHGAHLASPTQQALPDPAAPPPTTIGGLPPYSVMDPTHAPDIKPAKHKHRVHAIPPGIAPHQVDTSHEANPAAPLDPRGIEDFPYIAASIIEGWRHLGCTEYLESLLDDNLDGSPHDLPPGAVEEIILLQALLKEK
jgi:hypothetical protein